MLVSKIASFFYRTPFLPSYIVHEKHKVITDNFVQYFNRDLIDFIAFDVIMCNRKVISDNLKKKEVYNYESNTKIETCI